MYFGPDDEQKLIDKIAEKLTPEEKEFFMEELVGYPRAINCDGSEVGPNGENIAQDKMVAEILEMKKKKIPKSQGVGRFYKAYAKFLKKHPEYGNLMLAWQQEVEKLWPEDKELQAFYKHNHPSVVIALNIPAKDASAAITQALSSGLVSKYQRASDVKNIPVDASMVEYEKFTDVDSINNARTAFIEKYKSLKDERTRAILDFRQKFKKPTGK